MWLEVRKLVELLVTVEWANLVRKTSPRVKARASEKLDEKKSKSHYEGSPKHYRWVSFLKATV